MADNRIEIEIVLDDGSIQKGFAKITDEFKKTRSSSKKTKKALEQTFSQKIFSRFNKQVSRLRTQLLGLAAGFIAFRTITRSIEQFRGFERQLVAVGKTTDLADDQLKDFGARLQQLSKDIPVSSQKLLGFAEAAGQLGVEGAKNLSIFAETLARLESATDIVGQEGARALARVLKLTGTATKDIDRFGSALVDLGNNFEATESQILRVTTEIAKSTTAFNLSSTEVLAFGAAIKSLGGQAESAGTAVGKTLRKIAEAVVNNGKKLKNFNEVLGTTGEELKKRLDTDAAGVFQSLIKNLSEANLSSVELTSALTKLGLVDQRVIKTIAPLINRYDVLEESVSRTNQSVKDNTALTIESDKAFDTLDGSVIKAQSAIGVFATNLTERLSPALRSSLKDITEFFDFLNDKVEIKTPLGEQISAIREEIKDLDILIASQGRKAGLQINIEPLEARLLERQKVLDRLVASQERFNEEFEAANAAAAGGGLDLAAEEALTKSRIDFQSQLAQATESRINTELRLLGRFRDAEIIGIEKSILFEEKKAAVEAQFLAQSEALRRQFDNRKIVSQTELNNLIIELERQKALQVDEINRQSANGAEVTLEKIKDAALLAFQNMEISAEALGDTLARTFVVGFSAAFSAVGRSLATGKNAFESFGKSVLNTLGGLAIQLGSFFILVGTGLTATSELLGVSGSGAIAAGIGLTILGGVLQGLASGGAGATDSGGGAVGGATVASADGLSDLENLQDRQAKVEINIQGNVLDRRETGLELVEILQEAFDTQSATVVTV